MIADIIRAAHLGSQKRRQIILRTSPSLAQVDPMPEKKDPRDLLKEPLHGIYIPVALIIAGTAIFGLQYIPYVMVVLVPFLAFRFYSAYLTRQSIFEHKWTKLELLESTVVSKNTAIYRFKLKRDSESLDIPVGHHLIVESNGITRHYTPISAREEQGFFDIMVKSYADGNVSKDFAALRPGQTMQFKGPIGRFNYRTNEAKEIGMIAGGSGITPILQVISEVTRTPNDLTKLSLIYANETENDILLKGELDELAEKYPYFSVYYTLSKPPTGWTGGVGYVTKEMIAEHLPKPSDDSRILVCGPAGLNTAMVEHIEALGFPKAKMPTKGDDQVFIF